VTDKKNVNEESTSDVDAEAKPEATAPEAAETAAPEATEAAAPEAAAPEATEATAPEAAEAAAPEAAAPETAAPEATEAAAPEATEAAAPEAAEAPAAEAEADYMEETPREKPAIPGADLIPDIVVDGDQFMDAEARAAAEAEAEEAAQRAAAAAEHDTEPQPIADAAINLAAGARYTATGKRKTGVARVILKPGTGVYSINGKTLEEFFPRETLQRMIRQPLEAVGYDTKMDVVARMHGGGVSSQAGALRHGISRALLEADPNLRGDLKRRGFLTRDPRVKERKKAGLKKARKRPQFSKR